MELIIYLYATIKHVIELLKDGRTDIASMYLHAAKLFIERTYPELKKD